MKCILCKIIRHIRMQIQKNTGRLLLMVIMQMQRCSQGWVGGGGRNLVDQLTQFKPGADYAPHIAANTPKFKKLSTVKSACKDPSFSQSLVIFANQTWQLPEWPFQTLTYMFYNLSLQIQTIEGALQYKIAPLTPPKVSTI